MTTAAAGLRKRTRPGTFIPRALLRDNRLSFKARGLLANLLDRPLGWDVRAEMLATEGPDGKAAIQTALQEVRAAGYYRLERRQGPDGRFSMGTAISEEPVAEWVKDNDEYGGKAVPVVWRDGQWWVRHLDGSLTADGFEGYDDGNLAPGEPVPDDTHESGTDPASSQVTPETDFPAPENPGPENPASGSPGAGFPGAGKPGAIRRTEEGFTEKNFRTDPPTASQYGGAARTATAAAAKPRSRRRVDRSPEEQAQFEEATAIARTWWDAFKAQGVTILGSESGEGRSRTGFPGLRDSIVLAALKKGAQPEHVKRALVKCGDPFPPLAKFQRALIEVQTGQQARGHRPPPPNVHHDPTMTADERAELASLFDQGGYINLGETP